MTADDFVRIVRKGSDKLRVDSIVLDTGKEEFHGSGMLRIEKRRFALDMRLNDGEKLPEMHSGVYTKKDAWKLRGIIEYDLEFKCDTVSPVGKGDFFGGWRIFGLHPIYLIPSSWDAMSDKERSASHEQLQQKNAPAGETKLPAQICSGEDSSVRFEALLFEYPFFDPFCGREWKGEIDGFDFTLKKEREGADLWVSLESKKDYISPGEKEDLNKFYALMASLAFTNGAHAWPYRIEHWRGGRKITDFVTAVNLPTRISHGPFTDNLAFHGGVVKKDWDYQDILKKATAFFEANSTLSQEITQVLFLLREADAKEVHSDVTMIALCALFENLIQLLFRELKLEEKAKAQGGSFKDSALQAFVNAKLKLKADISRQMWTLARLLFKQENLSEKEPNEGGGSTLFNRAKSELGGEMDQQIADECEGLNRMYGWVGSAAPFSTPKKFEAILDHLQFDQQWRKEMESAFSTWKEARNKLFHHKPRTTQSEDEMKQAIFDQCQIAGTINVLILKLIGYSGLMRASTFEGKYR